MATNQIPFYFYTLSANGDSYTFTTSWVRPEESENIKKINDIIYLFDQEQSQIETTIEDNF